jgi:regulatory protein
LDKPGFLFGLAVRYLARSDKSKAEVAAYLSRQGASRVLATATLRRLERLGYLNEAAHALRLIERRLAQRPMGRLRMREELRQRGFSEQLIEDTIHQVYGTLDETELAAQALVLRGGRHTVSQMGRFLQGRGFSPATIARVLHLETEE